MPNADTIRQRIEWQFLSILKNTKRRNGSQPYKKFPIAEDSAKLQRMCKLISENRAGHIHGYHACLKVVWALDLEELFGLLTDYVIKHRIHFPLDDPLVGLKDSFLGSIDNCILNPIPNSRRWLYDKEAQTEFEGDVRDAAVHTVFEILRHWEDPALEKTPEKYKTASARNIDRLRLECGWSYNDLEKATGISKRLIVNHIKHGTRIYPKNLKLYADQFTKQLRRTVTVADLQAEK